MEKRTTLSIEKGTLLVGEELPSAEDVARTAEVAQKLIAAGGYPCKDCNRVIPDDGTAQVRVYPPLVKTAKRTVGYAEIICGTCAKLGSN